MKINEITDENKTWAALIDFDLNTIVKSFEIILDSWPILLKSKATSLISYHKRNILSFIHQVDIELAELENFPDQTDPDLLKIRETLTEIKNKLIEIIN